MLYTFTNVDGFSGVAPCKGHTERADADDPHFSVNCPICEPVLAADRAWKRNPDDVPLTADEKLVAARIERENAKNQVMMANGLADALGKLINPPAATKPARKRKPRAKASA